MSKRPWFVPEMPVLVEKQQQPKIKLKPKYIPLLQLGQHRRTKAKQPITTVQRMTMAIVNSDKAIELLRKPFHYKEESLK